MYIWFLSILSLICCSCWRFLINNLFCQLRFSRKSLPMPLLWDCFLVLGYLWLIVANYTHNFVEGYTDCVAGTPVVRGTGLSDQFCNKPLAASVVSFCRHRIGFVKGNKPFSHPTKKLFAIVLLSLVNSPKEAKSPYFRETRQGSGTGAAFSRTAG